MPPAVSIRLYTYVMTIHHVGQVVVEYWPLPRARLHKHIKILSIATVKMWSCGAALSCTICTNLYLFPVILLCTVVQETAASMSQFA